MNKKQLILIGVLVVLIIAYIVSESSFRSNQKTFDPDVLRIDSAAVHQIVMIPASGDSIEFEKQGSEWKLRTAGLITRVSDNGAENLVKEISNLRIDRLASDDENTLADYNLTDSLATTLIVRDQNRNELARLRIGKVSFKPRSGQGMYGSQQGVDGITYFQMAGDANIYAATSFIGMMVTLPADNWRDHTLFQLSPENIRRVSVKSPLSEYILVKDSTGWTINGKTADTLAVQQYISQFSFQTLSQFATPVQQADAPAYSMTIESANAGSVTVNGIIENDSTLFIKSSANAEWFRAGLKDPLMVTCFKDETDFISKQKK